MDTIKFGDKTNIEIYEIDENETILIEIENNTDDDYEFCKFPITKDEARELISFLQRQVK